MTNGKPDTMNIRKELIDQSAHFAAAFIILGMINVIPHPITYALAGFSIGLIREITEEGNPATLPKVRKALRSYSDLTFWTLGGLVAGGI